MVKTKWFPRYAPQELPANFEARVISCDTANKASELSDYTVFTVWGVKDRQLWLLSVLRRRMDYYELKRVLKEEIAPSPIFFVRLQSRHCVAAVAISGRRRFFAAPVSGITRTSPSRPK